jgi:hypothetical protein
VIACATNSTTPHLVEIGMEVSANASKEFLFAVPDRFGLPPLSACACAALIVT